MSIGTSPQLEIKDPQHYFGVPTRAFGKKPLVSSDRVKASEKISPRPIGREGWQIRRDIDEELFSVGNGVLAVYYDGRKDRVKDSIELNARVVDNIAVGSGILGGSWLVFAGSDIADRLWLAIAQDTAEGNLGDRSYCQTERSRLNQRKPNFLLRAHTHNFMNYNDVARVYRRLFLEHSADPNLFYKPDIYATFGINSRDSAVPDMKPWKYAGRDIEI